MTSPAQGMTDPQKERALTGRTTALNTRLGVVRREILKLDHGVAEFLRESGLSPVKHRAVEAVMTRHRELVQKQKSITLQLDSATNALDDHLIKRQGAKTPLIASPHGSGLVPASPVAVAADAARGAGSSCSSAGTGLTASDLFSMADGDEAAVDAAAPAPAPAGVGQGAGAGSGVGAGNGLLASPHGSGIVLDVMAPPQMPAAAADETGEGGHEEPGLAAAAAPGSSSSESARGKRARVLRDR